MSNAFHYKWKKFLFEEQHQLLLEAKVKDVKKKYPKLNATNWIVWAQRQLETLLGPKGVSKYLMWFARELHSNFTEDIAELDIEDTHQRSRFAESSDVLEISEAILTAITEFQQNQQRMEEKDIYKYNAGEVQSALSRLGLSSKQKRDREKESAMGDTEVVYDDNDIFAVRPLSEISSCYFGKNTRWCISATETRNYFDQYTDDRKAFVMVRFENLPEDHVLKKIAIVYDSDGDIEEYFNAQDNSVDSDSLLRAVALNHKRTGQNPPDELDEEEMEEITEILSDLEGSGYSSVVNNPPDPTVGWEAKAEKIEQEYAELITHGHYSYEIDDYGEGSYMMFNGSFSIELAAELFEGGEYEMPDEWQAAHRLSSEISDKLTSASIYVEDIEIGESYNSDDITFELRISTDGFDANPDGYDSFLDSMADMDKEHGKIRRIIMKYLAGEGYIAKSAFDTFQSNLEELQKSLKNLKIVDYSEYAGEEEIRFISKEPLQLLTQEEQLTPNMLYAFATSADGSAHKSSDAVNQKTYAKLQDLNQAIRTYLAKQIELPLGLPPKVVPKLSLPESLSVLISTLGQGARIRLMLDNPEANQEDIEAVMNVVRFIDENYDKVAEAALSSIHEVIAEVVAAQKEFMENLPDAAKNILELGRQNSGIREVSNLLKSVDDISRQAWRDSIKAPQDPTAYELLKNSVLTPVFDKLKDREIIDGETENPFLSEAIYTDIKKYFTIINEAAKDRKFLANINMKQLRNTIEKEPEEEIKDYFERLNKESQYGPTFDMATLRFIETMRDDAFPSNARKIFAKWVGNNLAAADDFHAGEPGDAELADRREGFRYIRDFIEGAGNELSENIWSLSYSDMMGAAQDWHESLKDVVSTGDYSGGEIVAKFDGGYTIVKVPAEDLEIEGEKMGHCVGGYCDRVNRGSTTIFSLRDSKNEPHATIEVEKEDKNKEVLNLAGIPAIERDTLTQVKGKGNKTPVEKYKGMIKGWIRSYFSDTSSYVISKDYLALMTPEEVLSFVETRLPDLNTHSFAELVTLLRRSNALTIDVRVKILRTILENDKFKSLLNHIFFDDLFGNLSIDEDINKILDVLTSFNMSEQIADALGRLAVSMGARRSQYGEDIVDRIAEIILRKEYQDLLQDIKGRDSYISVLKFITSPDSNASPDVIMKIHNLAGDYRNPTLRRRGDKSKEKSPVAQLSSILSKMPSIALKPVEHPNAPLSLIEEFLDHVEGYMRDPNDLYLASMPINNILKNNMNLTSKMLSRILKILEVTFTTPFHRQSAMGSYSLAWLMAHPALPKEERQRLWDSHSEEQKDSQRQRDMLGKINFDDMNEIHINEEAADYFSLIKRESELDEKDSAIKSRRYDIIDIMDPDYNLWEFNNE